MSVTDTRTTSIEVVNNNPVEVSSNIGDGGYFYLTAKKA